MFNRKSLLTDDKEMMPLVNPFVSGSRNRVVNYIREETGYRRQGKYDSMVIAAINDPAAANDRETAAYNDLAGWSVDLAVNIVRRQASFLRIPLLINLNDIGALPNDLKSTATILAKDIYDFLLPQLTVLTGEIKELAKKHVINS